MKNVKRTATKPVEELPKVLRAQKLELYDQQGRKIVVIDVDHGVPCVTVYDGHGKIRCWLTFRVDGTPDIRFFRPGRNEKIR